MNNHLALLGHRVRDAVTGFEGIVETISFDLYGCVQAVVRPATDKKSGKLGDANWFDTKRLKVLSTKPVMDTPAFDSVPGGTAKPPMPSMPTR